MISSYFEEAFSKEWIQENIIDSTNELVILRQVIPWQRIINRLVPLYDKEQGRLGKPLRIMIALVIVARLRQLSDAGVVQQVKENRYVQYFCNVLDTGLLTFVNSSTLCTFRKRRGEEGAAIIEHEVFGQLHWAKVIENDAILMDSSVLENNIIYPNDVRLIYKAFGKMKQFAEKHALQIWWDEKQVKEQWRAFNLAKQSERRRYLTEFSMLFDPALATFRMLVEALNGGTTKQEQSSKLLALLTMLHTQTQQKLAGETHIKDRLVSLDEIDARPIKKGKSYPSCEFGTTIQMTFNRQGFMITTENFIGQPNDKTLYGGTLVLFWQRMQGYPDTAVTDLGFRSASNFKQTPKAITHVFLGRGDDVTEDKRDFCKKARSATEGFIAVAKHLRGFGCSLYRGLRGDRVWTLLSQTAYNLKKFVQLFYQESLEEKSLVKLGL